MIAAWLASTFDIGENLTNVLLNLFSLLGIIFAGGVAVQAKRTAQDVKRQTEPNGGASLRDAVDRIEKASKIAAASSASLHDKLTNSPAPLPPPEPDLHYTLDDHSKG